MERYIDESFSSLFEATENELQAKRKRSVKKLVDKKREYDKQKKTTNKKKKNKNEITLDVLENYVTNLVKSSEYDVKIGRLLKEVVELKYKYIESENDSYNQQLKDLLSSLGDVDSEFEVESLESVDLLNIDITNDIDNTNNQFESEIVELKSPVKNDVR